MRHAVVLAVALGFVSGCSSTGEAAGVWEIAPEERVDESTTSFTASVGNIQCTSGREPIVENVEVVSDATTITITVSVRSYSGDQDCQGTGPVDHVIELQEPVGDRSLVDGGCVAGQPGQGTGLCPADGVRYDPGAT